MVSKAECLTCAMWVVEDIPDQDGLYYRVHQDLCPEGVLTPTAFRAYDDGMSTDWTKYSTPSQSLNRAKTPTKNGLVELQAGSVRNIAPLTVVHDPDHAHKNRAHTLVKGPINEDVEIRVRLSRIAKPVFAIPPRRLKGSAKNARKAIP